MPMSDELRRQINKAVCLPNVVVSGVAGAAVHGLPVLGNPGGPVVSVEMCRSRVRPGGLVPHRTRWRNGDVVAADGFLVTSPLRTLIDLSPRLVLPAAVAAMDHALHKHLVTVGELAAAADAARGPGSGAFKKAAGLADGRAESVFESISRVAVIQAGWGPVRPQLILPGDPHRFDVGIAWASTVGECQGREFHEEWNAVCLDYEHSLIVARSRGWALVPWVWRDMWPRPERGLLKLLGVLVTQPGRRSRALRRQHLGSDGVLRL